MTTPTLQTGTASVWICDRDPTSSEDTTPAVVLGNFWINTTYGNVYICTDPTTDNLQWAYV